VTAARILLIGILALASISLLGTIIAFVAPYIAALIVLWIVGAVIWRMLRNSSSPE
jgi:hypothetical protein